MAFTCQSLVIKHYSLGTSNSLKPLLKWSSLPHHPEQGTLRRAAKNSLKLVPSPNPFQHNMERVFLNESLKSNPGGFQGYASHFLGRWERYTDIPTATLLTNKAQRGPGHEVLSKLPHTVLNLPAQLIYLFSPILEQPANDFTPFCLAAKSNTITPLRAASVGSKNKMDSFSC